jgi:hypothetical protein
MKIPGEQFDLASRNCPLLEPVLRFHARAEATAKPGPAFKPCGDP